MCFKNIQDATLYFRKFTQNPPLWAILCFVYHLSLDLFKCHRARLMCFLCDLRISKIQKFYPDFTRTSHPLIRVSPVSAISLNAIAHHWSAFYALKKKVYWINKFGGFGVPLSYFVKLTRYVIRWIHFVVVFLFSIYKMINSITYGV